MSFVIDTNILLYAVNQSCDEHKFAKKFIEERIQLAVPGFLTWNIIYEFLRVSTHRKVFPQPLSAKQALSFVKAILETEVISVLTETERHPTLLEQTIKEQNAPHGNILHDLHSAVLMAEHGIKRIYTHDSDFLRFKFLEVVNPWD